MLLSVDQSIQLVRKAGRQTSRAPLVLHNSASRCQARCVYKCELETRKTGSSGQRCSADGLSDLREAIAVLTAREAEKVETAGRICPFISIFVSSRL
jgi:hypothetical protein